MQYKSLLVNVFIIFICIKHKIPTAAQSVVSQHLILLVGDSHFALEKKLIIISVELHLLNTRLLIWFTQS